MKQQRDTRRAIMEATIDLVAEHGLEGCTMKPVTDRAGVATGIPWHYFESKDKLLYECFLLVNSEIAASFSGKLPPLLKGREGIRDYLHDVWVRYFRFLIASGSHAMFYYAYRESPYFHSVMMENNPAVAKQMEGFSSAVKAFSLLVPELKDLNTELAYLYLIDGTGIFVKHAFRDKRAPTDREVEEVWQLMSGSLLKLMNL